jgi:hypothetical protein
MAARTVVTNDAGHTLVVDPTALGFDVRFVGGAEVGAPVEQRTFAVTAPTAPPPPPPPPRQVFTAPVVAKSGDRFLNCDFRAGLRVVANDVWIENCTVERPQDGQPALYLRGNRITAFNVIVRNCHEGVRLEGGDAITLRAVVVSGLKYLSPTHHADAIQVYLQQPLTNLLIEDCDFDGTVAGDTDQLTANGSQFDGRNNGGGGGISGIIRRTAFKGGRYYSNRYYNIVGPLRLEQVTHVRPYVTNSAGDLVLVP